MIRISGFFGDSVIKKLVGSELSAIYLKKLSLTKIGIFQLLKVLERSIKSQIEVFAVNRLFIIV